MHFGVYIEIKPNHVAKEKEKKKKKVEKLVTEAIYCRLNASSKPKPTTKIMKRK